MENPVAVAVIVYITFFAILDILCYSTGLGDNETFLLIAEIGSLAVIIFVLYSFITVQIAS